MKSRERERPPKGDSDYNVTDRQEDCSDRDNCDAGLRSTLGGTRMIGLASARRGVRLHLAADPQMAATVYAGTCGGVFKTEDGSVSWTAMNSGLSVSDCVGMLVVDPQNEGTVYAASCQVLFKTTDGEISWSAINSGLDLTSCHETLAIVPRNPTTLYTGGSGVFKSTDGGLSWIRTDSGVPRNQIVGLLAIDPQHSDTLCYAGWNPHTAMCKFSKAATPDRAGPQWVRFL